MRAAILAVGSELLGSDRVDTNSLILTALLKRFGVTVGAKTVVGDQTAAISSAVRQFLGEYPLILITGGLGPTQDDVTRESVSEALGLPLVRSEEVLNDLRRKFERFGMKMAAVNEKQADVIVGAEVLVNRRGTAPGLRIEHGRTTLFLFPGVPTELEGLIDSSLEPWLRDRSKGEGAVEAVLKVACVPESTLEQKLQVFYEEHGEEGVALLPSPGEVTIRLTTVGPPAVRRAWLEPRRRSLRTLLGSRIFGESSEATLEESVGQLLGDRGLTLCTAESCTGGLIAERLTRVPGSSLYFVGAIVAYSNRAKGDLLDVPAEVIADAGAVSESTAKAMAKGARRRLGANMAVAVTGIAGPGGGSEGKPVGTVHLAVAGPQSEGMEHRALHLPGDRDRIRWVTSQWALELTRRILLESAASEKVDGTTDEEREG
jgi:nicotinamide-nucleotide amidase